MSRELKMWRRAAAVAVVAGLALGGSLAPAQADDLDDQLRIVRSAISTQKSVVDQSGMALGAAQQALAASQSQLVAARAVLGQAQAAVAAAQQVDEKRASELGTAVGETEAAVAKVAEGQASLNAEHGRVGQMVREQYQQNTQLLGIASLIQPESSGAINNRLQWTTTLFSTTQAQLTRLEDLQSQLKADQAHVAVLEARADTARKAAAAQLGETQRLETAADTASSAVAALVAANAVNEGAATTALAADQRRYAELQAEQASVDARIQARIAAERAAAALKAEQERQAVERATAASAPKPAPAPKAVPPAGNSTSRSLIHPVDGSITSPYGMRVHPVTGIYKLHDGTDFGASCGTPIAAAASGVVTEEYYNGGYGNRIFVDHGSVNGRYLTTAYNHLSRYAVSVGQRVSQGQVIGYVGTTGYSTGCHLHLMLWVNGTMVNPMSYF